MLTGNTKSGFQFKIEDQALDDYEILEMLTEIDDGNGVLVPKMIERLLGKEQKEALKEHLRNKEGKVSTQNMMIEVMDIFKSSNEGKNS
ncbi:MAG: hypothetical protein PUE22_01675 [Roseburia porci]|nr:hypothetical protein [Roseburia porci]